MRFLLHFLVLQTLLSTIAWAQSDTGSVITGNSGFAAEETFLPVEEAYQLNAEFESNSQLRLNWQIADGY